MVMPTTGEAEAKQPSSRREKRKSRVRDVVTIFLQLLAAVLLVSAIFWAFTARGGLPFFSSSGDSSIPDSIAGYKLQQKVVGQSALDELTGMHGKDVELSNGWIGRYQGGGTVWFGTVASEAKASELIARMSSKIGAGNATFTNLRQYRYEGVAVYSVIGIGQQHFYYQAGKNTIWLAAPRGGEEPFLKDALRVLK